jgi:hypothetical protein
MVLTILLQPMSLSPLATSVLIILAIPVALALGIFLVYKALRSIVNLIIGR